MTGTVEWQIFLKGKKWKLSIQEDADVDVACDVWCELVMSKAASMQDERLNQSEEDSSVNESLERKAPLSSPDLTNLKHRHRKN